jgi:hypothetical protein
MAHDRLLALPLPEGYSNDVVDGRRALLDHAKERVLYNEGRVMHGPNKGIDVPVHLLPSALALLAQVRSAASICPQALMSEDLLLCFCSVECHVVVSSPAALHPSSPYLIPQLLYAQLNQNAAVSELASKLLDNWDMRRTYKRDLTLSLAIVRCNIARELLADQKARP